MGYTTIIEINHDEASEIFYNDISKQEFLNQIKKQTNSLQYNGKKILGGRVILGFHRSGLIYNLWENFKDNLQNLLNKK